MQHKNIFTLVILAVIFVITLRLTAAEEETNKVTFLEDKPLKEITAILKKENKPGLLYFTGPYCSWCQRLQKEVFTVDSVINYIEANFVPIKAGNEIGKSFKPAYS